MPSLRSAIDRRTFLSIAGSAFLIPAAAAVPSKVMAQSIREKILWTGVNILQSCSAGETCNVKDEFPRIHPILTSENPLFLPKINSVCQGEWGTPIGKNRDLQLTWQRQENNFSIDPNVRIGAFIGIAADTVLGAAYTANLDKTLTLYGLQTYLIIFDVDKFEILQSYPMRIMSARDDAGNIGIDNQRVANDMLMLLGYEPPPKDLERIWLPNLIWENLNKLSLKDIKPVNMRVTDVTVTDYTKNWLLKQNKDQNLYQGFLGHSLTQSISEVFKIGIQPHSPSKATYEITQSFVGGGRSTLLFDKNLNTAPIDLEFRAIVRGILSKEKALERYNNAVKEKTLLIAFIIECGRWKRTYDPSDKQKLTPIDITLKEPIFKQEIEIRLTELRTDEFSNDWQMILDLQQRAIDWFMKGIYREDYQNLATGFVQRGDQRFIKMRVNTKEVEKFVGQAKAMRHAIMGA